MPTDSELRASILSQYQASITMLRNAVEQCPADLWIAPAPNHFWHIAWHALFYTHLYLSPTEADCIHPVNHQVDSQFMTFERWKRPDSPVLRPYTRDEVLAYADFCLEYAEAQVVVVDLDAPSGFYWQPIRKFEMQVYNIRHIQHHAGQLIDRLRIHADIGIEWEG